MNTTFEYMTLKDQLSESNLFGSQYAALLVSNDNSAFLNSLSEDVGEMLNKILIKYDLLTPFQKGILQEIFNQFNTIRLTVDPSRLKSFNHFFNEDDELLLYRQSPDGLINIIVNPEDCVAFSFIPTNNDQRKFYFILQNGDFEMLAYDFFSH